MSLDEAPKPLNEGAIKAGNGDYISKLSELARIEAGRGVSTGEGPVVEGARMQVGLIKKKEGPGRERTRTRTSNGHTFSKARFA